ncbi:unnamed protein product [Pedinophyceae sp. YPF-701]|nr:unnamed protein product [Pedinophyceae sp. YPF-701]
MVPDRRTAVFMVVGERDVPLFEADFSKGARQEEGRQYLHSFVLHASLDIIDQAVWKSPTGQLKRVDRFNDLTVTAHVMADLNVRLLLLHDFRGNDDGVRQFLTQAQELYLKASLSPFHNAGQPITSDAFRARITSLAARYMP